MCASQKRRPRTRHLHFDDFREGTVPVESRLAIKDLARRFPSVQDKEWRREQAELVYWTCAGVEFSDYRKLGE